VISRMKTGAGFAHIVALSEIPELHGIRLRDDCIEIGAATTHRETETDPLLRSRLPAVADYMATLGNIRIRCQGTVGGNIMADEPGYEILALLLVLDATLNFCDLATGSTHPLCARDFASDGAPTRSLGLLTSISVPLTPMKIVWSRDLRPALALVAGIERQAGRPAAGGAALVGAHRRARWAPLAIEPHAATTGELAARWAAALPPAQLSVDTAHARRVGAVLLRRALVEPGLPP
jgi:CO/xanthine dehydrogenase FAD-binding subunit